VRASSMYDTDSEIVAKPKRLLPHAAMSRITVEINNTYLRAVSKALIH
jgi:hypothetical protein